MTEAGHNATHVRLLGLAWHTDDEVMALALREDRVLVTTDTDFGTILALTGAAGPNVLLLRAIGHSAAERVAAILDVLPRIEYELVTQSTHSRCSMESRYAAKEFQRT